MAFRSLFKMLPPLPGRHPAVTIETVLQRMTVSGEDPLVLIRDLVAALRPRFRRDDLALHNWRTMLELLRGNAVYRRAAATTLFNFFAGREQRPFYTDAGLLPNTGFFSELRSKLTHKLLPDEVDPGNLQDCVRLVFPATHDPAWLYSIPDAERNALWQLLADTESGSPEACRQIQAQLLDGAVVLGHRIAAMGLEPELLRILPRLGRGESPFIALCNEVTRQSQLLLESDLQATISDHDGRHLLVLLEQCREAVERAHQTAANRGTSMQLTFLVVRLKQHLERLEVLMALLTTSCRPAEQSAPGVCWLNFLWTAIAGEQQRNSVRKHVADLLVLLSLRVTDNAGRTGEHYIALDRREWHGIWRAAAGAGFLIAFMALMKILGGSLNLALLNQGLLNGAIYGGGFALIHICRGTVATKQPAMTAATIAATISQTRGRLRDIDRLAELIVATARSQFAAIAGNVLVAFPLAVALALAMYSQLGGHPIEAGKAIKLLQELDPLHGGALLYAAVAGVWLFVAGLVSGYVDNQAAYSRLGARVACHPWLTTVLGKRLTEQLGGYLDRNAGGLAGNLFFGMMLGLTPTFGTATGLPLDIRHIAFSAANLGYALISLDFLVQPLLLLRSIVGVALIGALNLAVSFSLALGVALRSRGVNFTATLALLPELWNRMRTKPSRFFMPD
jgi:site-specific recombinase